MSTRKQKGGNCHRCGKYVTGSKKGKAYHKSRCNPKGTYKRNSKNKSLGRVGKVYRSSKKVQRTHCKTRSDKGKKRGSRTSPISPIKKWMDIIFPDEVTVTQPPTKGTMTIEYPDKVVKTSPPPKEPSMMETIQNWFAPSEEVDEVDARLQRRERRRAEREAAMAAEHDREAKEAEIKRAEAEMEAEKKRARAERDAATKAEIERIQKEHEKAEKARKEAEAEAEKIRLDAKNAEYTKELECLEDEYPILCEEGTRNKGLCFPKKENCNMRPSEYKLSINKRPYYTSPTYKPKNKSLFF